MSIDRNWGSPSDGDARCGRGKRMRPIDADEIKYEVHEKLGLGIDYSINESDVSYVVYKHQIDSMPTVDPMKWIPIKSRPMNEEERAEWSEKLGYEIEDDEAVIYTSQLPDDGQEVLTCSRYGEVRIDTFENDPDYGCSFEENGDMDGIVAWMPKPDPWKGGDK